MSCRRHVTGDGIGGLPTTARPPPDHPLADPSSPGAFGSGDDLPNVDVGGEIMPAGGAGEESLFAVEQEEEAAEEEDGKEREQVEVAPSSSRRKRHRT